MPAAPAPPFPHPPPAPRPTWRNALEDGCAAPVTPQDAHFVALGRALQAAVKRDFGAEDCTIQGAPVTAQLVEQLAREHSRLLFLQQQVFGNALAEANRCGEAGRKDEMKRIFGIDV